jgi:inorganic pyrophosphatase
VVRGPANATDVITMAFGFDIARLARAFWPVTVVLLLFAPHGACDFLYYRTMKRFGVEKRDILVDRVRDTRKSQEQAKEQFRTALERFKAVVEIEGGSLEDKYESLNRELERSEDRAWDLHDHIKDVKDVAHDLFNEWQKELERYGDLRLRAESERELRETKRRADPMIASMERAEERVEPVLQPLRDRVLFLKHNLNANAIGTE